MGKIGALWALSLVLLVLTAVAWGQEAQTIAWVKDLATAQALAKQENKLVMVDLFTEWCHWCQELEKKVYPDARVVRLVREGFVAVKVDGEQNRKLVEQFKVEGYPTVVILEPGGSEIKRITGYEPAEVFAADLAEALELWKLKGEAPELEKKLEAGGVEAGPTAARLGYIYRRLGEAQKARQYLEQARAAGVESPDLELDWVLLTSQGADRVESLLAWRQRHPEHARQWEAGFELGYAQAKLKRWEEAVASFEQVSQGAPDSFWGLRAGFLAGVIRQRYLQTEAEGARCGGCGQ
jgi:thioredoxin-related protein